MSFLSTTAGVGVVDARTRQGTITLPLTSQIPNRYLQFKDLYGAFGRSSLTLSTQAGESFDDGTTSKIFTDPFTFLTLYAASTTRWAQLGGTQTIQQTVSSLIVSSITIGSGYGWIQLPPVQTAALSTNTIYADTIITNSTTSMFVSAQILYVSSIMGAVVGAGNVTTSNLQSTVAGLGQIYLSSGGAGGGISAANLTSTVQGLATVGYLSSVSGATGFVSSLTVNALTLGTGAGWLQMPPIQTIYSSTILTQAQALYSLSSYFGNTSTATTLEYWGLFGNYNNTVLAEVSTGAGTQEFLVFKGSSASDRVRFQTTGNFVVETGVSARLWNDNTTATLSNATPAFIINTSSNVGIQTASPGTTLDVAGTGRFQLLSTLGLNTSSINGGSVFTVTQLTSTTQGLGQNYLSTIPPNLSTTAFFTSSILASTITTSSLQVNSLTIGTGTGWLNLGPLQTVAISSIQDNTNALYANTSFFGTTSTVTALQMYGLFGNYNNTVLAEVSTGAGTQELLVFKGSSTSDRVRVQTTGNFVIETGVTTRLYNSNTTQTLSNVTPAFIINTSSNVGIQTASPGATLDVAGTGRFQNLSTLNINLSTINGQVFGQPINSTVIGLGTVGYISTSQLVSTVAGLGSGFTGSTNTLSAGTITVSSITGTFAQFQTLSSQSLFVSSFFTATRQATPMFVTF